MTDTDAVERLEHLAAWHRTNADRAGAAWVWDARLRTAEDLERQAAELRRRIFSGKAAPDAEARRVPTG